MLPIHLANVAEILVVVVARIASLVIMECSVFSNKTSAIYCVEKICIVLVVRTILVSVSLALLPTVV